MEPPKILFTDDDELILLAMGDLLDAEGFDVTTASSGREGLDRAREVHFDLVIVDLIMPGLLGVDVCRELRRRPEYDKVPIIMLTAKSGEEDRARGLAAGANLFLPKPIDPARLLENIRAALARDGG